MSSSRIVELASIIQENTTKLDSYLSRHNLPAPSFDISYPARVTLPPNIQALQDAVLEALDELTALLLGPAGSLIGKDRFNSWASTQVIERFGIAKAFPPGESATFEDIVQACSLPVSDTRRILRHAMTSYIFTEPSPGVVAHTAASKVLAEITPLAQCIGFLGNEMWPSASRVSDAMQKWPVSEEPNQAGFAIAYGTDTPMFDVVSRDPERAKRMAGAMSFMHSGPAYSMRHVVDNFDWGDAAKGLLVDVGGGRGTIGAQIARLLPRIRCIVQDLPDVINGAEVPEDLRHGDRLHFMSHNFFQEQPVKGADIYYLRWVLHDWSDKYAVHILQNLIPALKKGARVLVSELCMPPPGTLSPYKERSARTFDLGLRGIQNAKEHDPDDWALLFCTADARYKLHEIQKPLKANLSIIYATWGEMTCFDDPMPTFVELFARLEWSNRYLSFGERGIEYTPWLRH